MALSRATPAVAAVTQIGRVPVAMLAAGVVAAAALRIALAGWGGVAPDDARYLYVGLGVLDGHGPLTPDGTPFLLRSPAYGVALAAGSRVVSPIAGGDVLLGARLVAVGLMLLGLVGAVRLAWLLGGASAATVTAGVLVATPLIWRLVPTLRIDLVQASGVVAVLLLLRRPTPVRWALAGAVLGLTVLVKESALLLLALPLAWLEARPTRPWLTRTAAFLAAAAVVAAWWWIVVWVESGTVFPANALAVIESRLVGTDLEIGPVGVLIVVLMAAAWTVVMVSARKDGALRSLALSTVLLLPPAIFAFVNGLDARNYAVLAVLGAVAVGVAGAHLAQLGGRQPVVVAALPLVALVALAGLGQVEAGRAYEPPLPAQLAAWLGERVGPGDKVATTFRFRALVAVELYGRTVVEELRPARVRPDDDPADYVWMGLRDRQLFGYRRGAWVRTLGDPSIRYLAIVEPHFFAPLELEPFLASADAESTGLQIVERLEPDGPTATILSVDPSRVADGTAAIPLHVTPEALGAWLSLAGPDAAVKMASARPVVTGEGSQPDVGCFRPAGQPFPEGWLHLEPCA